MQMLSRGLLRLSIVLLLHNAPRMSTPLVEIYCAHTQQQVCGVLRVTL